MDSRVRKAERIVAVQRQLQRIEDWKMAELDRRLAELDAGQRELILALNGDEALHGLFIDSMARRLRSLAEEADRTAREKDAQAAKRLEQAGRVKVAERISETIDREAQAAEARKELLDIAERYVAWATTSLR